MDDGSQFGDFFLFKLNEIPCVRNFCTILSSQARTKQINEHIEI